LLKVWRNAEIQPVLAQRARAITRSSQRLTAEQVFEQLIAGVCALPKRSRNRTCIGRDDVVTGTAGAPLFRIRIHRRAISLLIPIDSTSPQIIAEIRANVAAILQHASLQAIESTAHNALRLTASRRQSEPLMSA
jgi:hypothetical protein